jgi:hypothetical protein
VCDKDWIDAENRMQHNITFEAATSAIETQESGIDIPPEDDSDGRRPMRHSRRRLTVYAQRLLGV